MRLEIGEVPLHTWLELDEAPLLLGHRLLIRLGLDKSLLLLDLHLHIRLEIGEVTLLTRLQLYESLLLLDLHLLSWLGLIDRQLLLVLHPLKRAHHIRNDIVKWDIALLRMLGPRLSSVLAQATVLGPLTGFHARSILVGPGIDTEETVRVLHLGTDNGQEAVDSLCERLGRREELCA